MSSEIRGGVVECVDCCPRSPPAGRDSLSDTVQLPVAPVIAASAYILRVSCTTSALSGDKGSFWDRGTIAKAFSQLDSALQCDFNRGGMDSLSVAVVGSDGSLYEGFWGQRRANESDIGEGTTVDRHSIYRVTTILRRDDPISSVCPEFKYNKYYAPITFRSLMSHTSGLGADLPPGNAQGYWPKSLFGRGPPGYNDRDFPSYQELFDGIAQNRPVVAPYTYPVYLNTGNG